MVLIDDQRVLTPGDLLTKDAWDANDQRRQEEDTHDGEGKDPLECNGLDEELGGSDSSCQHAERKPDSVVLSLISNSEQNNMQNRLTL